MHLGGAGFPQQLHDLPGGGAPDDGVVHQHHTLAAHGVGDGVQLNAHGVLPQLLGGLNERAADVFVLQKADAVGDAALLGITQGRVQTSAASVAVLPEAGEFDIELNEKDIRKDTFCSSGPGGQSVNTTYSAIRLTHIPTGIVVQCQDEKSQLKNYDKALNELRTRIYNMEYQKYLDNISAKRKTMVSTGDRSAKIRTYNYQQSRVTDHRINYTMYNLPVFMDGAIQDVIDQLIIAENAERLKEAGE